MDWFDGAFSKPYNPNSHSAKLGSWNIYNPIFHTICRGDICAMKKWPMQIFTTHRDSLVRTLCFLFALPQLRQIMRGRTETITFQCEGWNFSPQFDEFLRRIAFAAVLLPGRERAPLLNFHRTYTRRTQWFAEEWSNFFASFASQSAFLARKMQFVASSSRRRTGGVN